MSDLSFLQAALNARQATLDAREAALDAREAQLNLREDEIEAKEAYLASSAVPKTQALGQYDNRDDPPAIVARERRERRQHQREHTDRNKDGIGLNVPATITEEPPTTGIEAVENEERPPLQRRRKSVSFDESPVEIPRPAVEENQELEEDVPGDEWPG